MRDRQREQRASKQKRRRTACIPGHVSEVEAAEELGVSVRTLRKWRQLRVGPPWTAVGRKILYRDESRAAWLKSREVLPVHAA